MSKDAYLSDYQQKKGTTETARTSIHSAVCLVSEGRNALQLPLRRIRDHDDAGLQKSRSWLL